MEQEAAGLLLDWYHTHKRSLPWRDVGDPYATWVSEIMLQQTRVDTVMGYFPRFMARFPDVRTLAEAPEADVLKQWEGLGYYSRARNLQKGARQVMAQYGGRLPATAAELRQLCGVGDYTAGAIASIAFGERVAAVDGNVIRVISRLYGIHENAALPDARRSIVQRAEALLPAQRPGDLNQALMDLGATICTPGTPDCATCPLHGVCAMTGPDEAAGLPVLPVRTPPKELRYRVWLIRKGDRLLMHQRTEHMLQGLWVFPMTDAALPMPDNVAHVPVSAVRQLGTARHVFTHQVWLMEILSAVTDGDPRGRDVFASAQDMAALAIPTAMRGPKELAMQLLSVPR